MLEWATAAVNICVTADHWVPWVDDHDEKRAVRWAQAKQLAQRRGSHHCVLVTGQWRAPAFDPQATYGPLGWDALTFCEFMGWYLSEGSCDGTYRVNVAQQERHLKLEQSLDATGLTWRRAATSYRISHRGLVAYLSQFGKAKEKFVPDEIKQFPSWLIRRFIDSYTLGDGNRRVRANGAEEHTVYTTSARMKNDMQELALKAGWHSSVRGMKPQRSYIQEASGVRAIRGTGGYNITFKKRASEARLLPNKLRRFHYEGMVYCVRVPFHTLYVRRNGKPSWNGNTPCCLITQITPGGQWRWLRELQLWNKGMRAFVEFLVPMLKNEFFGYQVQTIWQDPQGGNMRVQTDETTCADILRAAGFNVQDGHNNWALRKEVMKQRLEIAPNGEPGVLVSRYGCPMAAEGLLGAYRYAKTADGLVASVPIKNEASHLQDAAQMIAVGEFSVMSGLAKMEEIKQKVRLRPVHNPLASNRAPRSNALGWMGR
jgi:hypothetical protein